MLKKSTKALSAILSLSSVASVVAPVTTLAATTTSIDTLIANALKSHSFADYMKVYQAYGKLSSKDKAKYTAKFTQVYNGVAQMKEINALLDRELAFSKSENVADFYAILADIDTTVTNSADKTYLKSELNVWGLAMLTRQPNYVPATDALIKAQAALASGNVDATKAAIENAKLAIAKVSHEENNKWLTAELAKVEAALAKLQSAIVSAKATNATTVEVSFKEALTGVNAADFAIDGLDIVNAAVKQTDSKVVVLTTKAQEAKDYTVKYKTTSTATFKGVSAVIPTGIDVVKKSIQSVVGSQVIVQAKVTVPSGASAEGIAVTFNVDAPVGSLNEDKKVEVLTDKDGVASYTYTQYNAGDINTSTNVTEAVFAGEDDVTAYPTGAPAVRSFAKVYWGVQPILSVTTDGTTAFNGQAKSYKVKLTKPKTGEGWANRVLYVNFKENMDVPTANDSNAVATDVLSGRTTKPFQATNGQNILAIKTNANGEATFTITGTNTTVTPIVFADNLNDDDRLDARELQAEGPTTTISGVQVGYQFKWNVTAPVEAVPGQGYKYELQVFKADGTTKYSGGTVIIGLDELIDNNIYTTTPAYITDISSNIRSFGNEVYAVKLDGDGKANFKVNCGTENVSATPVAWIDLNDVNAKQGVRETQEPQTAAPSVTFRREVVKSISLSEATAGTKLASGLYYTNSAQPEFKVELKNQNDGSVSTASIDKVTYTVTNTGNAPITVNFSAVNFVPDLTSSSVSFLNNVEIAAGNYVTITGLATTGAQTASLLVTNTKNEAGKVEAKVSVTTKSSLVDASNNLWLTADAKSAEWVGASAFAGTEITGTVKGFRTQDFGNGVFGEILVKSDADQSYYWLRYGQTLAYFAGTQTDFNRLVSVTPKAFENAMTVDDRVSLKNNELRLINVDGKNSDLGDDNTTVNSATATVPGGTSVSVGLAAPVVVSVAEVNAANAAVEPVISSVAVDGTTIAAANYAVDEAANTVTLTAAYLNTLTVGNHTVAVTLADGQVARVTIPVVNGSALTLAATSGTTVPVGLAAAAAVYTVAQTDAAGNAIADPAITGATVTVNGTALTAGSYTVNEAANTVSINQAYLNTLAVGTYTVRVSINGLSATQTLVVNSLAAVTLAASTTTPGLAANTPVVLTVSETDAAAVAVADPTLTGATVSVNGTPVALATGAYTINDAAGTNTITINPGYLDTLTPGSNYTITITLADGLSSQVVITPQF